MKILHRFVLSAFIPPLAATFLIVMFVLVLQFLWLYIDDLVGKGLEPLVVVELLFYAAINLVTMALPLSVLLSSIMVMGNLGEHGELMALKASGISLRRIELPIMLASAALAVGSFVIANNVLPYTNLKFTSLLFSVKQQRPELQIKAGVFYDGIEGYVLKVNSKDEATGLLHDVMIYDHSAPDSKGSLTIADSGYLRITGNQKYLIFTLYNGNVYEEVKENGAPPKYPLRINSFRMQETIFELIGYGFERSDENLFKNRATMLNVRQLSVISDSLKRMFYDNAKQRLDAFFHSSFFTRNQELGLPDSIIARRYKYHLTQDSIIKYIDDAAKSRAAARALERARQAKSDLISQVDLLRSDAQQINRHDIQWHLKFSYPLACIIFFFVGAPLGAIMRKGGIGSAFVVSLIAFLLYYVISIICEKIARDGVLNTTIAMWIGSVVTAVIGAILTYKTAKDRSFALPMWYLAIVQKVKTWRSTK